MPHPTVSSKAWARIEIVKCMARNRLRNVLATLRRERLAGRDEELYFQFPLCFACADYVRDVFFAQIEEFLKLPGQRSRLAQLLNETSQELVARVIPVWKDCGGKPDFKDFFVETAFKVIQASPRYEELLHGLAAASEDEQLPLVLAKPKDSSIERSADPPVSSLAEAETNVSVSSQSPKRHSSASRQTRKAAQRHPRYSRIDDALRQCAEALPRSHQEVFQCLDRKQVPLPHAEPFESAGGWMSGFRKNPAHARAWLSKAWSRLGLTRFPRSQK